VKSLEGADLLIHAWMSLLDGRLAQEHLKQCLHGTPQEMKFANLKWNFQSYQPPVHHKARAKIHAWFK